MSAISPVRENVVPLVRGSTVVKTEPCAPIGWLRGRLLSLTEIPRWQAFIYRLFKLPPLVRVEPEGEDRVMDIANLHYTRARGAALCDDKWGYVLGVAFETEQGAKPFKSSTFSRPRHPAYAAREEKDSAEYTSDLREYVEMTLTTENAELKSRLKAYERLLPRANNFIEKTDRLL